MNKRIKKTYKLTNTSHSNTQNFQKGGKTENDEIKIEEGVISTESDDLERVENVKRVFGIEKIRYRKIKEY